MLDDLSRCHGVRQYPAQPELYFCPLRMSCWRFVAPRDLHYHGVIPARFTFGSPTTCEDYWPIEPMEISE